MDFDKQNIEMIRKVIQTLIERGDIISEEDAVQKFQDCNWLNQRGYSHVAHIMGSPLGKEVCQSVFSESHAE